jgi:hypothetical protein
VMWFLIFLVASLAFVVLALSLLIGAIRNEV